MAVKFIKIFPWLQTAWHFYMQLREWVNVQMKNGRNIIEVVKITSPSTTKVA